MKVCLRLAIGFDDLLAEAESLDHSLRRFPLNLVVVSIDLILYFGEGQDFDLLDAVFVVASFSFISYVDPLLSEVHEYGLQGRSHVAESVVDDSSTLSSQRALIKELNHSFNSLHLFLDILHFSFQKLIVGDLARDALLQIFVCLRQSLDLVFKLLLLANGELPKCQ